LIVEYFANNPKGEPWDAPGKSFKIAFPKAKYQSVHFLFDSS